MSELSAELVAELLARITALEAQVAALQAENATLRAANAALHAEHATLRAENRALRAQATAAERAAKRQVTPFARKTRNPAPKKPGRRAGQGRFARRAQPAQVHVHHTVPLPACPHCAGPLVDRRIHTHWQIETPPVAPVVTQFDTESGYCACCQRRVRATHPEQISTATGAAGVVLGPRFKALVADLHHRLGVSYGKIADLCRELWGLPVTRGGLAQADARLAEHAAPYYDQLLTALRASPGVHVDETSWRIGALAAWLWVFTNEQMTVYHIDTSRGHDVILTVLGREFRGILGADGFRAYDAAALDGWLQQKCLAHLLRNIRDLAAGQTGGALVFPRAVQRLLREALAVRAALDQATTAEERARWTEQAVSLADAWERLIAAERQFTNGANAALAARLRGYGPDVLRFLFAEEIEGTNNRAERALRMAVITRKTGGCNRTTAGARAHAILTSVAATCRQQAISILDFLTQVQQFGATPPSLVPDLPA
jgi:transposase